MAVVRLAALVSDEKRIRGVYIHDDVLYKLTTFTFTCMLLFAGTT